MIDYIRALFGESDSESDESEKTHVCLCHEKWFDSQEELEQHLQETDRARLK